METLNDVIAVAPEIAEDILTSFAAMDPIQFARHISPMPLSNSLKSALLQAKIEQKPKEQDDAIERGIEKALSQFWTRLITRNASESVVASA